MSLQHILKQGKKDSHKFMLLKCLFKLIKWVQQRLRLENVSNLLHYRYIFKENPKLLRLDCPQRVVYYVLYENFFIFYKIPLTELPKASELINGSTEIQKMERENSSSHLPMIYLILCKHLSNVCAIFIKLLLYLKTRKLSIL